jgi:cation:H+ antiporter
LIKSVQIDRVLWQSEAKMPGLPDFATFSAAGNAALFVVAAVVVWLAGARLALIGDELSERYRLEKEFVGLIFLAGVSKLPEIVTSITGAQIQRPDLVLGALFGSIAFNTAILAVADFFIVRGALTSWPRSPANAVSGVMLITLLSVLLAIMITGDLVLFGAVGIGGLALALCFPLVIGLQRSIDRRASWAPVDLPDTTTKGLMIRDRSAVSAQSTWALLTKTAFYSLGILVGGVALTMTADALALQSGLGASFVGVTLLAIATSLPEFSTTIASVRIGAYTMALANIFGSNLITVALITPADLAYPRGAILSDAGQSSQLAVAIGIAVTAIYVAGILIRRTPRLFGAGIDSWLVIFIYLAMLGILFALS